MHILVDVNILCSLKAFIEKKNGVGMGQTWDLPCHVNKEQFTVEIIHGEGAGLGMLNFGKVRKYVEKAMAPHYSTLAWKIPGTAEPGGLPSMGSHRVRHD